MSEQVLFIVMLFCTLVVYEHSELVAAASVVATTPAKGEANSTLLHFGFETENGHKRTEDIKIMEKSKDKSELHASVKDKSVKPVEYRGGYSFISADGYEYMVLYKANKNGFQPYVTARKLENQP